MAIATATPTVQTKSVDSMLLSDCDTAGSLDRAGPQGVRR